jgi:ABC-type dipeptide/oligopeptide/nickel transport system ATPase subunit
MIGIDSRGHGRSTLGSTKLSYKTQTEDLKVLINALESNPDFDAFSKSVVTMWTDLSPDVHPKASMRDVVADMLVIRGDNDFLTNLESMARLKAMTEKVNLLNVPFA